MPATTRRLSTAVAGPLLIVAACSGSFGTPSVAGPSAATDPSTGASPSAAPSATQDPSVAPSISASPSVTGLRTTSIRLDGEGPIDIALDGRTAWVIATDSGDLLAIDLDGGPARSFDVGPAGSHVILGGPDEVLVAKFDAGGGNPVVTVKPSTGAIGGVATGPLAGFDLASDGRVWALGTAGEIVLVDAGHDQVVGRSSIAVHPNEHLDAVTAGDAFWASSDTTGVRRLEAKGATTPRVTAEIETGGGIPLAVARGLVWGARPDELWGIDPKTNAVTVHVPLRGLDEILDLDVDEAGKHAWIAARKPGRVGVVVGVEIPSGRVLGEVPVSLPAGIAIGSDRVWATNYDGDELIGIVPPSA
ncbi:MAG TPA: hypothetical protein VH440_05690 [Candidatus Limnocylindrales bacterium]